MVEATCRRKAFTVLARRLSRRGIGLLLLIVMGSVGAGCGTSQSELKAGDCFRGNPLLQDAPLEKIDCPQVSLTTDTWRVVSNVEAEKGDYPSNIDQLGAACEAEGGQPVLPSAATWSDGDRSVLCVAKK